MMGDGNASNPMAISIPPVLSIQLTHPVSLTGPRSDKGPLVPRPAGAPWQRRQDADEILGRLPRNLDPTVGRLMAMYRM